jgi:hypothetical protein
MKYNVTKRMLRSPKGMHGTSLQKNRRIFKAFCEKIAISYGANSHESETVYFLVPSEYLSEETKHRDTSKGEWDNNNSILIQYYKASRRRCR